MPARAPSFTEYTFSSRESIDTEQQDRRIFDVYSIYRLVLSLVLLISFYYRSPPTSPLGIIDPTLFLQLCIAYALLNLANLLLPLTGMVKRYTRWQYFAILITDIILLVMLSYTCGGVSSGMAHLLVVPIAAGSMLFRIRLSTFLAAVASLAIGYSELYLWLSIPNFPENWFPAGMLGLLLFMTTLTLHYLVSRIRQKELINLKQAASIESLQAINQQIIERMQTGIIVVDDKNRVLDCNTSARRLLGSTDTKPALPDILVKQLGNWLEDHFLQAEPFRLSDNTPQLQASFAQLHAEPDSVILIFLEDNTVLSSKAQHLKLMSLGRLTASIAHEIRNPLGAISHACQLLEESQAAGSEEHRLLDIINTHSQRVNSIIQNILDLSRHRQELPAGIELKPWLEQFHKRFLNSYKQAITLQINYLEDPGSICFIPGQLDQLLTNLCDNGLRYSRKYSGKDHLEINVGLDEQTRQVLLDVIDEGPGVAENDSEQIFEPFFTTESSGTGLGLFICKEICEANQARLFFRRNTDGRSCFRIVFSSHNRLIH